LVGRVPAAEIEAFVVAALRNQLRASGAGEQLPDNDRELLERHLERVTLTLTRLELRLRQSLEAAQADNAATNGSSATRNGNVTTISLPWTSPVPAAVKGIIHVPAHNTPITPSRRETLLMAIAKARNWVDELAQGRVGSCAVLAKREGKVERHIRLLSAARVPLTTHRLGPPRRDGAGGPHRHGACSRAALVMGRAGAAHWVTLRLCAQPTAAPGFALDSFLEWRMHVLTDA
jgi:hypothetical protein